MALLVGGRGRYLANLLGGRYTASSFFFDLFALGGLILLLRLFDLAVRLGSRKLLGQATLGRRLAAHAVHVVVVVAVAGPLILSAVQLHPQRIGCGSTPRAWGLPFRDASFMSRGKRLSAWDIPGTAPERPVVLIAHGLNANKANFLEAAVIVHGLGYHAFIFDFPGHGDSEGHTCALGASEWRDVKAAHDRLRKTYPSQPVYGLGYSMGGAATVRAAAEYGLFDKIVLDSVFADVEHVARATALKPFGIFQTPVWRCGRFWGWIWSGVDIGQCRPERWIGALGSKPLMLIHGTSDPVIPFSESERLHEASGRRAILWPVPGEGHLAGLGDPAYPRRLGEFFGR